MTAAVILPHLQRWADVVTDLDSAMDALDEVTGCNPESRLRTAIYAATGLANEWAAAQCNTTRGWIEWYWLENNMGAAGMEAGFDGQLRKIETLEALAAMIAEHTRRATAE